jgi:TRAP-type C4-dicarboxylate transport system permease small subunit
MKNLFHKINQVLSAFSGWLMFFMMVLLILDIVSRGVGKPFQGIAEMSVFVMMIVIYLGLARCEENDENVRIEIFLIRMPWTVRKYFLLFIDLIQIGVIGAFFVEMVKNTLVAYRTHEAIAGTVQLPIWPVKVFIVIGLFFYFTQIIINALAHLRDLKAGKGKNPPSHDRGPTEAAF